MASSSGTPFAPCQTSFTPQLRVIQCGFLSSTSFCRRASMLFDLWPPMPAGSLHPCAVMESPRKAIFSPDFTAISARAASGANVRARRSSVARRGNIRGAFLGEGAKGGKPLLLLLLLFFLLLLLCPPERVRVRVEAEGPRVHERVQRHCAGDRARVKCARRPSATASAYSRKMLLREAPPMVISPS